MLIPKKKRNIVKILKTCAFPGCDVQEYMTGRAIYCQEHRKRKYRSEIDKRKKQERIIDEEHNNPNQYIDHLYTESHKEIMNCALEGCYNTFEITILPRVYTYPKYCLLHRNAFKRQQFLNTYEKL